MTEDTILEETEYRLILAGLARAAMYYQDEGDEVEAARFWSVRDKLVGNIDDPPPDLVVKAASDR